MGDSLLIGALSRKNHIKRAGNIHFSEECFWSLWHEMVRNLPRLCSVLSLATLSCNSISDFVLLCMCSFVAFFSNEQRLCALETESSAWSELRN